MECVKTRAAVGRHLKASIGVLAALLVLGCAERDSATAPKADDGGSSAGGERCLPAEGTSGNPKTISEAMELVNGLPHPVQLPCVLESLDRPLSVNANFNTQSAQPALGKRSPRIFFILNESLSMSLVPGADPTLEFGERNADEPGLSVKAELHFPIDGQLVLEDAFSRLTPDEATGLTLDQATRCGLCHGNEKAASNYQVRGAFASLIVRPTSFFAVDVAAIKQERDACDSGAEPERCALLHAMFDHGEVVQTAFP
jgi:hypothetical protein